MRHDTFKKGVKLKYKTKTTERKPCNNVLLLRFLRNEYPVSRKKKTKKNKKHANAGREVHYKCMFF